MRLHSTTLSKEPLMMKAAHIVSLKTLRRRRSIHHEPNPRLTSTYSLAITTMQYPVNLVLSRKRSMTVVQKTYISRMPWRTLHI